MIIKLTRLCKLDPSKTPLSGVSDQVQHKPDCTTTEDGLIEALNYGFRKQMECTIYVGETKALICGFVFAYAKCKFSRDVPLF